MALLDEICVSNSLSLSAIFFYTILGRQRFNKSALLKTKKLDKAIALPDTIGDKSPKAASGIPMVLNTKAQNKFCRILDHVFWEISIAPNTKLRSPLISVTLAACMATWVPVPMAIPTSA